MTPEFEQVQCKTEEQQCVFGIFPNFYISYESDPAPLTAKRKFQRGLGFRFQASREIPRTIAKAGEHMESGQAQPLQVVSLTS